MKEVKVKVKTALEDYAVRIDDSMLSFDSSGNASKKVKTGEHYLQYWGNGPNGRKFAISITAPAEAKWSKALVVKGNVVGGSKKFKVNQS